MLFPQDEKNQVLVSNVWIRQVSDWSYFRGVGTGGLGDFEKICCVGKPISIYWSSVSNNRPQNEALGNNPTNSVFIPKSLVLRSIVWDWILIYGNWSVLLKVSLATGYIILCGNVLEARHLRVTASKDRAKLEIDPKIKILKLCQNKSYHKPD